MSTGDILLLLLFLFWVLPVLFLSILFICDMALDAFESVPFLSKVPTEKEERVQAVVIFVVALLLTAIVQIFI